MSSSVHRDSSSASASSSSSLTSTSRRSPSLSTDSSASSSMEATTTTERELATDAHWKLIQKNTFTRWTNEHLKTVNRNIADLESDLSDGLRLIALIEVLAGKRFQKYNKQPKIRTQKLENITMVLKFLQTEEKIKLVNIDSSDIVDSQLKLILGLVWKLILHYSISKPTWNDEDESPVKKEMTPKQRLLAWIQNKIPDRPICNFTTDWNDGTAIGALVDGVAPGLCPDWDSWNAKNALPNATDAMNAAEKWLDIPQLIRPEEMCNSKVDELSMMTYLSQFPNAKLKPGAPLRPRTNAARVRTYGPGLDANGNSVGAPARFTVETFSAGKGELDIDVFNPNGLQESHESVFNNDQYLTYSCSYIPTMEGQYKVQIRFANREIAKSPFNVCVEGTAGDPTKVTANGRGLNKTGNVVKKKTEFDVFTKHAGVGTVDVVVIDPRGDKNSLRPTVTKVLDEEWHVEYVPITEGLHSINIFFAGTPIPISPVSILVSPALDASRCHAYGRGIQATGLRVGDMAPFQVETKDGGVGGQLDVKLTSPTGHDENVAVRMLNQSVYDCCYAPKLPGQYTLNVTYGGQPIARSPFEVKVQPVRRCAVRAYGPGLVGGIVGFPACFTVETNGEQGTLGFSIEGPSKSTIKCNDNEDGSAEVSYYPLTAGHYAVHILYDDEDINNSPFMANIQTSSMTDFNPTQVDVYGSGIEPTGIIVNETAEFMVDVGKAGKADLDVCIRDVDLNFVSVSVKNNEETATYSCRYVPTRNVKHTVTVGYGGVSVPRSPFRILVQEASDPGKVCVFGPAFDGKVITFEATHFTVDCKVAGPGDVAVALADSKGNNVSILTTDNEDNTFRVEFEPTTVGDYVTNVYFAEKEIPKSPFTIHVLPSIDLSRVKVHGLSNNVFLESPTEFFVDVRSVSSSDDENEQPSVIVTAPSGDKMEAIVTKNADDLHSCLFTLTEEGLHSVEVCYKGLPIPQSPYSVSTIEGNDPTKVKAFGLGLTSGVTGRPQQFTVDTRNAGKGGLSLAIEGPSEAKMSCRDNRDGTCTVDYLPIKRGIYDITVKFAEQHIQGSAFQVQIKDELDATKVRCSGGIFDEGWARIGEPVSFIVNAVDAGESTLDVTITDGNGASLKPEIAMKTGENGLYEVSFQPKVEGQCSIHVSYGNEMIPNSPFCVRVLPKFEPSKVKVSGVGISGRVFASLPTSFDIDTSDAGHADLEILVKDTSGSEVPRWRSQNKDGRHVVTYTTDTIGQHLIDVKYGGQHVTSSPFHVNVETTGNIDNVKIVGEIKPVVAVGDEISVAVDKSLAGPGNVTCHIHGDGVVKADVKDGEEEGRVRVKYALPKSGFYKAEMNFGGQPIHGGHFEQEALDADKYSQYIKEQEQKEAEEQEKRLKESSSSGFMNGNLHMNGGLDGVDLQIDDKVVFHNPVEFNIPVGPIFSFVHAQVNTPSGKCIFPKVIDNKNGTVSIRYLPTEVGVHTMDVMYNNNPVAGSPFQFSVDAVKDGNIVAHGPGLVKGFALNRNSFVISATDVDIGGLVVLVEGPSKTEIQAMENEDGTCTVSYEPKVAGDYQVHVKIADTDIPGSPFAVKILPPTSSSADDSQIATLSVDGSRELSLMVNEDDVSDLIATVRSPSGKENPCILKNMTRGHLGLSFPAKEIGSHFVSIMRSGHHINQSPFKINIVENQLSRVDRVKAFGRGLIEGKTDEFSEFFVDFRDAGFGNLSLSIEGPGTAQLEGKEDELGMCRIQYKPSDAGNYVISVKFADEHVNGSPFVVRVLGESCLDVVSSEETIKKLSERPDVTHVGCECELRLTIKGVSLDDLEAAVMNPSCDKEICRIRCLERDLFNIVFVPQEIGVHLINIKHRCIDIPGSPFRFTVGPVFESLAEKVNVAGSGFENLKVNESGQVNINTSEAGTGNLSIRLDGPSKAKINVVDKKNGSCDVNFICTQTGDYTFSVRFNGQHVPHSPFRIKVSPSSDNNNSHLTQNDDDDEVIHKVNRPASLVLNMSSSSSSLSGGGGGVKDDNLKAVVVSPSGSSNETFIQQLNNNRYAVRFVPHSNGRHEIHVKSNGRSIKGSPFQLIVGKQEPNPSLVSASGEGLNKGCTGQPAKFEVKTSLAGPGVLAVQIDGPSKVEMSCEETEDGFALSYVPHAPGIYQINLMYGREEKQIPNSPFVAQVEGRGRPSAWNEQSRVLIDPSSKKKCNMKEGGGGGEICVNGFHSPVVDISRVVSSGQGLHKGLVNKETSFTVDTSKAGESILLVGVMGPTGPCEEVNVKHLSCGQFAVAYRPNEHGNHLVVVRWDDKHVPGSPFDVWIQ